MELRLRAVAAVPLLLLTGCVYHGRRISGETQHESQSIELDKSEKVAVEIRMGAGELKVNSGTTKLMDADFAFNDTTLKPIVHFTPGSLRGHLTIEEPSHSRIGINGPYEWNLRFNEKLPLEFDAKLGAGNVDMRLGALDLRNLEVHMGVGNLDLDLRGEPTHDYDVQIRGGVGNATVYLPSSANIIADAKGGVGNINARGLEKHNGQWTNAHAQSRTTIHLDIHGGVGNISLMAN